jgi:hypothetical protein
MAYLEIRKDKALLQSTLDDEAMSIGRLPGNSVVINDPDISRRHCVIEKWEGVFSIYDLGSRNGTKVNGSRVQRTELKDGDVITIGSTIIKFVEGAGGSAGAGRSSAGRQPIHRAIAWGLAIIILLVGGFLGAWATGLLGRAFEPGELSKRLAINDDQDPSAGDGGSRDHAAENEPTARSAGPQPRVWTDVPLPGVGDIEGRPWNENYIDIGDEMSAAQRRQHVGRAVTALFVGKPLADDRGDLVWELPPDGSVTATLAPADAEAQRLLTVLMDEPLLVEAQLAGVLERDAAGDRLLLRVGVIHLLHAWGGRDDSLQPATRSMLGQRLVLNPQYSAQAIESRSGE